MAEAKATKREFLEFMREREMITAYDLIDRFGYSYSYACKRLSLLKKQGLVHDMGDTPSTHRGQWCLTEKGHEKLHFLQQREKERDAVIKQEKILEREEMARLQKRVEQLKREKLELEDLVRIFTGPGGLEGEVARLLREYEGLVTAYARAPKLGVKPEQLDLRQLTSCLEKLLKYRELLPAEEREKLVKTLGLRL
jgi:HD superfamily phosphodiesterase